MGEPLQSKFDLEMLNLFASLFVFVYLYLFTIIITVGHNVSVVNLCLFFIIDCLLHQLRLKLTTKNPVFLGNKEKSRLFLISFSQNPLKNKLEFD